MLRGVYSIYTFFFVNPESVIPVRKVFSDRSNAPKTALRQIRYFRPIHFFSDNEYVRFFPFKKTSANKNGTKRKFFSFLRLFRVLEFMRMVGTEPPIGSTVLVPIRKGAGQSFFRFCKNRTDVFQ